MPVRRLAPVLLALSAIAVRCGGDGSSADGAAEAEGRLRPPAAAAPAPPAGAAAVREVETSFSFARPPFVHPRVVETFVAWSNDVPVVGIDLLDARVGNQYGGEVETREMDGPCPLVTWRRPREDGYDAGSFSYRYAGMTDAGVHVLVTSDWGGGSGVFRSLLLLVLESSPGIEPNRGFDDLEDDGMGSGQDRLWDAVIRPAQDRVAARKLGEIPLGDRWDGEVRVRANEVFVGRDQGWFVGSGADGGVNNWGADRGLTLDFLPAAPLDFAAHRGACAGRR